MPFSTEESLTAAFTAQLDLFVSSFEHCISYLLCKPAYHNMFTIFTRSVVVMGHALHDYSFQLRLACENIYEKQVAS